MAYSGYLFKVGEYTIPEKLIISYSCTANIQDLDSYRDALGYLQRNALEHVPVKAIFEIAPLCTDTEFETVMSNIRNNYTVAQERKFSMTAWVPEYGDYVTQDAYFSDPTVDVYGTYDSIIHYNSIKFTAIGY